MISPLPGTTTLKPGSATFPLPGIGADIVDDAGAVGRRSPAAGTSCSPGRGRRCCAASGATPSATARRTGAGSPGKYFAGDGAKRDDDGYFWLLGRVDDVMLVSGHNISTAEVEHALVGHPAVAEAAVVGTNGRHHRPGDQRVRDPARRQRAERRAGRRAARPRRRAHRPIAKPKTILFTEDLPKTRSGKIMRRLLRDVARGPGARRHHDARRPVRRRGHQGRATSQSATDED